MQNNDIIISLAFPIESALGLIRISGPLCKNICNKTFNLKCLLKKSLFKNYRSVDNKIINEVILIFMNKSHLRMTQ